MCALIDKDTPVEDILAQRDCIGYFIGHGVSPFTCSGAFPQSLGKLLEIKRVADPQAFIDGLNEYLRSGKA
jgi:hypothetical protein